MNCAKSSVEEADLNERTRRTDPDHRSAHILARCDSPAAPFPWHRPAGQARCSGVEYVIGQREIGHIHEDALVDIPFPKRVRDEIVAAKRAQPHHILPETGWVSIYLRQESDVDQAIALLRESYQIAQKQKSKTIEVNHEQ